MQITRYEQTVIPQTTEGRKFADEYEKRLRDQLAFDGRSEGTQAITISAVYYFDIKDDSI